MKTITIQIESIVLNTNKAIYFLLLCAIVVLTTYSFSQLLSIEELYTSFYEGNLANQRLQDIKSLNPNATLATYALIPVTLFIKLCIITLCLMIGFLLFDIQVALKKVFHAVLFGEFIFVFPPVIKLCWFSFIQPDFTFDDIIWFYPLALSNLFNSFDTARWLQYPLQVVNIFEVAYWFWLAYCLSITLSLSYKKMFNLVLMSYLPFLSLWILLVVFFIMNLSL